MPSLLQKRLSRLLNGGRRVVILGIGSDLRGDDAAGLLVARGLDAALKEHRPARGRRRFLYAAIKVIEAATAPENFTGEIKRFRPTHLVIVDAVEGGRKPGTVCIVDPKEIVGLTFTTHQLPLSVMLDYLRSEAQFAVILLAIQAADLGYGVAVSRAVTAAAARVVAALRSAIAQSAGCPSRRSRAP
jgi:hydrogenase 3 maturation protease